MVTVEPSLYSYTQHTPAVRTFRRRRLIGFRKIVTPGWPSPVLRGSLWLSESSRLKHPQRPFRFQNRFILLSRRLFPLLHKASFVL